MDPLKDVSTRVTPQSERANSRQKENAAGGYGFQVGDDVLLQRFLVLGTTGGTYYSSEQELTRRTAGKVVEMAQSNPTLVADAAREISLGGRAPRQNPALFALAAAAGLGDELGRKVALSYLPEVARTGTHLFQFVTYVQQFRGWGPALRRGVGEWYLGKAPDALAYQAVKYRQREGWTHRDVLRKAHPVTVSKEMDSTLRWIVKNTTDEHTPKLITAFMQAQQTTDPKVWLQLIADYPISWEMLPDEALTRADVWNALVEKGMPQTALMRQLPRLTRLGVLTQRSAATRKVADQLTDTTRIIKGRIHPVNVMVAMRTYSSGHGARSQATWTPVRQITDALDDAFYKAFKGVDPANKRTLIALDVSGSMGSPAGGTPVTCREASSALALVTMATEPETTCVGFTSSATRDRGSTWGSYNNRKDLTELNISPRQRLDDVLKYTERLPFGGTDCSLPMTWATKKGLEFDTFAVYTDSETWAGKIHPHQALEQYRQKSGINARLVVVGMTATDISIADPKDPGSLDVAGFDSAVPSLIADFSRGDV